MEKKSIIGFISSTSVSDTPISAFVCIGCFEFNNWFFSINQNLSVAQSYVVVAGIVRQKKVSIGQLICMYSTPNFFSWSLVTGFLNKIFSLPTSKKHRFKSGLKPKFSIIL